MEKFAGYARLMARTKVEQEQNKPFLGKPYLKIGQCLILWAYSFQQGGILGAKHRANLDAFGHAFLGAKGDPGAVKNFFTQVVNELVALFVNESMTFGDYVSADFVRRLDYTGDPSRNFLEHLMDKIPSEIAVELSCIYSGRGAALAAVYPHMMQKMFDCTHAPIPAE